MKIKVGTKIIDMPITSTDNKTKLSDFLEKNLIIYFYPRDLTPGCTTESIDFNKNLLKIKRAGCNIVGVSRDSIKSHLKFIDKYSFKFPLISDQEEQHTHISISLHMNLNSKSNEKKLSARKARACF